MSKDLVFLISSPNGPLRQVPIRDCRESGGWAPVVRFGSDPETGIFLDDPKVSRRHAVLEFPRSGELPVLVSLGSPVRLENEDGMWREINSAPLRPEQQFRIGNFLICYEEVPAPSEEKATATAADASRTVSSFVSLLTRKAVARAVRWARKIEKEEGMR